MVKRYSWDHIADGNYFVLASDYGALEAEYGAEVRCHQDTARQMLAAKDHIAELEAELAESDNVAQQAHDHYQPQIEKLMAENNALAAELAASRTATETNFNLYRTASDRIAELEAEIAEWEQADTDLCTDYDALAAELAEVEQCYTETSGELARTHFVDIAQLEARIAELEAALKVANQALYAHNLGSFASLLVPFAALASKDEP